jgi:hypothetical protein
MLLLSPVVREIWRREALPATARWTLAASAMGDWFRLLRRSLRPHLGDDAEPTVVALADRMLRRRYAALQRDWPHLTDACRPAFAAALYQLARQRKSAWFVPDRPRTARGWVRAWGLLHPLPHEARWRELSVHLGEALIVLTEDLPDRLPRARQIVAEMCHDMGAAYARRMHRVLGLPDDRPVANAIEVLRTSEYLFRVNPTHTAGADEAARAGFIDGDACPWYERPGWGPVHCGIFGQFQAGVSSIYGLKYRLTTTIPRHGGDHCRIDLEPLRR